MDATPAATEEGVVLLADGQQRTARRRHGFIVETPVIRPGLETWRLVSDKVAETFEPHTALDPYDVPAIVISRGQLVEFAGRPLTDAEVERIADAWPNSSIPEALGTIADHL